jgi:SulP family sulfate permease
MAGVILVIMELARLGTVIKFIPLPVTLGFTNGIAILIFTTQIKDFLGLKLNPVPSEFVAKMGALFNSIPTLGVATVGVAICSLLLIILCPVAWGRIVPASIVAVVLGTLVVTFFRLPLETIGSRFGDIPQGLPPFHIPAFTWSHLGDLAPPAMTIALLAAIESLLSAVVADGMIDDRHDSRGDPASDPSRRRVASKVYSAGHA